MTKERKEEANEIFTCHDSRRTNYQLLGATVLDSGVEFRVWAPKCKRVEAWLEDLGEAVVLQKDDRDYWTGVVPQAKAGMRYRYRLDGEILCPDPCSRYQPEGPHGPSLIVDPRQFVWNDDDWPGVRMHGQVIYELHIGTLTPDGTFDAAIRELDGLKALGITLIELMPVAEFPGRWNWGYDGVSLYAPAHTYGDAEALKRFVDAAHRRGLGVLLDVVYNHIGPDGNYLTAYSDDYFTDRYHNDWGAAINFDGPGSSEVRAFFIKNACYWIGECRLDGLRIDATQDIHDAGPVHVLAELSRRAREAAGSRSIVLIGENEPQDVRLLAPADQGGYGLDALWNDDFHHMARVALTGRREAYYTDYRGSAQEVVSTVKRGFLYQGQRYEWQDKPRGSVVTAEPACAFVCYIQNHDQVANHLYGERIHALASPARYRVFAALMLLAPATPMLFMGQEFGASTPFLFFADHRPELTQPVHQGRRAFLAQFSSYESSEAQDQVADPALGETFHRSKLNPAERGAHHRIYDFHRDLLHIRRSDPVIAGQRRDRVDGAVLSSEAVVIRFFGEAGDDRLLLLNWGPDLAYSPAPEPLLAPVPGCSWRLVWSSDHPRYGGSGIMNPCTAHGWRVSGSSATFFAASPDDV
ncbi:MAG TPA: malto-oligosyltrehalose trehalohydrolase [Nitrospiraceae bacterium]|nr:malto-oligosyltrehalose trehalohydrolase [Nitrospiraceae bacterium]